MVDHYTGIPVMTLPRRQKSPVTINKVVMAVGGNGCLYNYKAFINEKLINNIGYKKPLQSDWDTLITYLGGSAIAGGKLKEIGFAHWITPNTGATDDVNFKALGSGVRTDGGTFQSIKEDLALWSESTLALALELTWDDIANVPVADASSVSDWNTFFDLPTNGGVFTSISVIGNIVKLYGGSGITLKNNLFGSNINLLSIIDNIGCIVSAGSGCFAACSSITTFNLPSLVIAGTYCFDGCTSATTFDFPSLTTTGLYCFGYCTSATIFSFPSLVITGAYCFYGCTSATSFSFPLVITINYSAFYYCTSATTFDFPSLTTAGNDCFSICSSVITFNFPSLVTAGDSCFDGCISATTFNLPLLTTAGAYCFYRCTSATTFDFPSLTTAGYQCFGYCSSANTFSFPLLVTMDDYCFHSCTSATTFYFPVCNSLGSTTDNNNVFISISGKTITLTIPVALMTCNGGSPDGDIQYLTSNNTVTIITV
jgi:hypothetical protein